MNKLYHPRSDAAVKTQGTWHTTCLVLIMKRYLVIFLTAAYVTGIVITKIFWGNLIPFSALILFLLTACILLRKNILLLVCILSILLGLLNSSGRLYLFEKKLHHLYKNESKLAGLITKVRDTKNSKLLDIKLKDPKLTIIVLSKFSNDNQPKIGQKISIEPPFRFKKEGTSLQKAPFLITTDYKIKLGHVNWTIPRILNSINQKCFQIHEKTLPKPYDALLASLIFGNTTNPLPDHLNEQYLRTGVIHLLVVSGAQVALLLTTFSKVCGIFHLTRVQTFVFSTLFNLFFVLLTGAGPSISRAGLMAEFALLGQLAGRPQSFYHTLSLSALSLLLLNPFYLFHIGFQLSFMATFALFYLAPLLESKLKPWLGRASGPLSISISPLILSSPLVAFYFNRISLVALPANLLAMMIVEILVVSGFLTTILGLVGLYPLALFLNQGNYLLSVLLNKVIAFLASFQFSQVNILAPNLLLLIGYYIFILFWAGPMQKNLKFKKKHLLFIALFLLILSIWGLAFSSGKKLFNDQLRISAIDVGQGDSLLIETPRHKKYLIDGGGYTKGDQSVTNYLAVSGINHLDGIILTHAHADHLDGLIPLINNLKIDWIITSGFKSNYAAYKKFMHMIKKKKIPCHITNYGQKTTLDKNIVLHILHPSTPYISGTHSPENDNSVVCRLVYNNFSMLFTGDCAEAGEHRILSKPVNLKSTILKAGHHGSRWSSNTKFLDAITPDLAIIPCGKNNRFKHPHKETLERFKQKKINVYRTDIHGNILIGTDGYSYKIITEK
ncbi:DNA internalization-related competence protein ComEC/Rec2 [Candidatus Margulisiibacteriota bacterium]